MPDKTGTFNSVQGSSKVNSPGQDTELFAVSVDRTAFLTRLSASSEANPAEIEVIVRESDGSNPTTDDRFIVPAADSLTKAGDVDEPILKIPAGDEIAVNVPESVSGDVMASVLVQEYNQ